MRVQCSVPEASPAACCQVLYNIKQKNFPKQLFEVRMYVLRPRAQQHQQQEQQGQQAMQQQ